MEPVPGAGQHDQHEQRGVHTSREFAARVWATLASRAPSLALLSAVLYLIGTWSPWLEVTHTFSAPQGSTMVFSAPLSGSDVTFAALLAVMRYRSSGAHAIFDAFQASFYAWDALPLLGILLSVAWWQSCKPSRRLVFVYAGWIALASVLAVAGVYRALTLDHAQVAWGLWLTLLALVVAWVSLLARLRPGPDAFPAADRSRRTTPRVLWRSVPAGATVFAVGVTVWALGLVFAPWVTAGCSGIPISFTHFANGSCMGLDGYDVLSAAFQNGPGGALVGSGGDFWLLGVPYHIVVVLVLAGIVLAVLLWRQARAERAYLSIYGVPVATAVWTLLVTLAFLVCMQGTTYRLGHLGGPAYSVAPQVVGPGIWLSAAGILLIGAGLIISWRDARMATRVATVTDPQAPR